MSFGWMWNVDRPAPMNPEYARRLDVQRDRALFPVAAPSGFDFVGEAIDAIDRILQCTVGRPKVWPRVDELLDARSKLRKQSPLSVPVIPGRSS